MPRSRFRPRLAPCRLAAIASLVVPLGCSGDDGQASGTGTGGPTGTDTGTAVGSSDTGTASGGNTTGGSDEVGGLLTFTYYLPDASDPEPALGFAAGLRAGGIVGIADFYAVYALQRTFPAPPEDPDTVVDDAIPVPFDWGSPDDWVAAGNGIKLSAGDTEALACLLQVDGEYPVYAAEASDLLDPSCAPDPSAFLPETTYALVVYGGGAFEDVRLDGIVSTPPLIEVTEPDLSTYNRPLDLSQDLAVAWTAGDGTDRIVIRVFDQFGRTITAHAADDGAFTIPAADLASLSVGPGFVTVARERTARAPLPVGTLDVVTRTELWGYVDLFEGG